MNCISSTRNMDMQLKEIAKTTLLMKAHLYTTKIHGIISAAMCTIVTTCCALKEIAMSSENLSENQLLEKKKQKISLMRRDIQKQEG